ncbi:pentatricopeptide repeat-containing protein 1, mitochondrial [Ahaetulla prasina]|uniref:pentatricopeptide repeat-containing protein 1, mitochondrial n=1 Tax=Ahaetulla prasina TaxID=499056 RepID=UPI0026485DB7|nr:pentatricopeptide repeat-containing protein 1, mitochondrial [Ahaetulla prasina]XP_058013816.1 pentatricopeptide repeat-containing protein 1, mitochondrial [Ahaetulla prasina]
MTVSPQMCRGFSALFTQRGSVCPWLCSVPRLRGIPGRKKWIPPPSPQPTALLNRRLISTSLSVYKLHNRDLEEMMRSSEALSKDEEEEEKFDADESFGLLTQKYPPKPFSQAAAMADFHNVRLHTKEEEEEEEEEELQIKPRWGRRNTPYWYFLQCKALIKQNKLAEALELFEVQMLKEERLWPEEFNYTVLIGGCGRVGYLKKALRLYNDMKKRDLTPTIATYTALFNACAETPWKDSGLQSALKLRQELIQKGIALNPITYRALLKCCALCSDLRMCLDILKEMVENGHQITTDTFNILLMGCINDKENGFRYALQVWQQMAKLNLKPDLYTYNLMLTAAKYCGIGDSEEASKLLLRPSEERPIHRRLNPGREQGTKGRDKKRANVPALRLSDVEALEKNMFPGDDPKTERPDRKRGDAKDSVEPESNDRSDLSGCDTDGSLVTSDQNHLVPESRAEKSSWEPAVPLPNLLDLQSPAPHVVSLGTVATPSDRLALMGNMEGFLKKMKDDKVAGNIRTFILLAENVALNSPSESSLLAVMEENNVKPDVAFFNTLIRKKSKKADLEAAKSLLPLMLQSGVSPDLYTFCNLAIACRKYKEGMQLLSDMKRSGIKPNVQIYGALINAAVKRLNYTYLTEILKDMSRNQVAPNEVIINVLEFAAQYPPNYDQYQKKDHYLEKIDGFRSFYFRWLKWMPGEETPHPWTKYRCKKSAAGKEGTRLEQDQSSQKLK